VLHKRSRQGDAASGHRKARRGRPEDRDLEEIRMLVTICRGFSAGVAFGARSGDNTFRATVVN
jgi:hypothetical protein